MTSFLELRAAAFRERGTAEWLAALEAADIPCAPVQSLEEVLRDPHLADTGFFERVEHPTEGRIWQLGIPNAFSRTPGGVRNQAPALAADTDAILRDAGLSDAEIEALVASAAVERGAGR
jgi:crotonobetainyl-CoA:carnitine CoA-transferase CaiB-like acyl-CoA transferase